MTASKKHLTPNVVNAGANVSATQPGTPKIPAKLMSEYKAVTATIEAERAAKQWQKEVDREKAKGKGKQQ